ncbi:MAG TPA: TetR/AcrR family transcriptional regulator [Kofleriaceae bacterium]|nr:TetR/AcrR family transcriptional regulator [Kofleriaceae bacterium]
MPRPKQRTRALRDQVLHVAVEMLAREGLAGFTTRKVARGAGTSTPAVYELFGDKAGLVRSVFFEGFRLLRRQLDPLPETRDPRADLIALFGIYRRFLRDNPVLAHVMFSRPFADFDPGPAELEAGRAVRELIVHRVRRCIDAGQIARTTDATDAAHVLVSLVQGLASAEIASRLGRSRESVDRRWALALDAALDGLAAPSPRSARRPGRATARPRSKVARRAGTR